VTKDRNVIDEYARSIVRDISGLTGEDIVERQEAIVIGYLNAILRDVREQSRRRTDPPPTPKETP
jgi:hypothetical protein